MLERRIWLWRCQLQQHCRLSNSVRELRTIVRDVEPVRGVTVRDF